MSYRWVAREHEFLTQTSKFSRCRAGISLLDPPEDVQTIKTYRNTDFVNIMVKKSFYEQLEEKAKGQETKPDVLIYNAYSCLKNLSETKAPNPRALTVLCSTARW